LFSVLKSEPKPDAVEAHAAVAPQTAPAAAPAGAVVAAAPAQKARVKLLVSASPARARLRLDGQRVENPYVAELPADEREHELVVTADGYEPEVRKLRFARDLELKLVLAPQIANVRAPRPPQASNAPSPAPEPRAPVVSPAPVRAGASQQTPASAQPGMDLKKPSSGRLSHSIDEKDPYQQ
jgi:hypothetical protein